MSLLQISGLRVSTKVDAKGEGSKGGHVIGHTVGGKPIYENHKHPSHEKFKYFEHHQAQELHEKLEMKALQAIQTLGRDQDGSFTETAKKNKQSARHHEVERDFKERKKDWKRKDLKESGMTSVGHRTEEYYKLRRA